MIVKIDIEYGDKADIMHVVEDVTEMFQSGSEDGDHRLEVTRQDKEFIVYETYIGDSVSVTVFSDNGVQIEPTSQS